MKTNQQSAATIRSLIRWATGTATTAAILVAGCSLFPLLGSFSAFSMTLCLAVYIGLQIALPPVDEEDDWVPCFSNKTKSKPVAEEKPARNDTIALFPTTIREAI